MARARALLSGLMALVLVGAAAPNQTVSVAGQVRDMPRVGARGGHRTTDVPPTLLPHPDAWAATGGGAIRGITLGPIESSLQPNRGYGTAASLRAMREARDLGANWISLTVFGRVWDTESTGVTLDFEQPHGANREAVRSAIEQAHSLGLRVLLVPHLWVESGQWRGELNPPGAEGWERWTASYGRFLLGWARFAEASGVDMLAAGVELRTWVTTTHAPSFVQLLRQVRRHYHGLLTYAGNWDDVEETVILGELDVIGINAFYPLADEEGASLDELRGGARRAAERVTRLAERWDRPVMFTEFGYTTRPDPAVRPWEWPEALQNVRVDEAAQADAYRALLSAMLDCAGFAGLFVWRYYADPADMSQEAEWGFSPRGKLAELVLEDAFAARWSADAPVRGHALVADRARSLAGP